VGLVGQHQVSPELKKPEKHYDLGYGTLGNGITVWNRAEEKAVIILL
jgi:hypothetical protein